MKMLVPSNITFKTMSLVSPPAVAVLLAEHAVQERVRGPLRSSASSLLCGYVRLFSGLVSGLENFYF